MSFLAARLGARIPFGYMGRPFRDLSYKAACQVAQERLEELKRVYGKVITDNEMEFVSGCLDYSLAERWIASKILYSAYIIQGP